MTLANTLLVGQVAFSFLLLMTAALFLRSIQRAYDMDPGFQTAHLATVMANPGQAGYARAQTREFYKEVRERVAKMPGVAAAVVVLQPSAVGTDGERTPSGREGATAEGGEDHRRF